MFKCRFPAFKYKIQAFNIGLEPAANLFQVAAVQIHTDHTPRGRPVDALESIAARAANDGCALRPEEVQVLRENVCQQR